MRPACGHGAPSSSTMTSRAPLGRGAAASACAGALLGTVGALLASGSRATTSSSGSAAAGDASAARAVLVSKAGVRLGSAARHPSHHHPATSAAASPPPTFRIPAMSAPPPLPSPIPTRRPPNASGAIPSIQSDRERSSRARSSPSAWARRLRMVEAGAPVRRAISSLESPSKKRSSTVERQGSSSASTCSTRSRWASARSTTSPVPATAASRAIARSRSSRGLAERRRERSALRRTSASQALGRSIRAGALSVAATHTSCTRSRASSRSFTSARASPSSQLASASRASIRPVAGSLVMAAHEMQRAAPSSPLSGKSVQSDLDYGTATSRAFTGEGCERVMTTPRGRPGIVAALSLLLPDEPSARARRDRWLALLFALLSAVLVVRAASKEGGVLLRNQEWGARFFQRQDPYYDPVHEKREHGPYPPSFALLAVPLAGLPTPLARIAWVALQIGALLFFLRLLRRRTREHWPALTAIFALALLLVSRYLLRDTAGGGGNLLFAALALGGVDLALRGREWSGGVPFALSLVLKPNLLPLLVFLGLRRRWRAGASTLAASAVLFALPAPYYGPAAYARLSVRWAADVTSFVEIDDLHASALVPEGLPPAEDGMNQSLREAVHRVLRPPGDSGADDVHLVEVSPRAASWFARALSAALLVLVMLAAWRPGDARAEWLAALAFLPLALLCSPVTWKAHHVVLLPVFHALLCCALEPAGRARWLRWFLAGYYVVCDLLSREVVGQAARDWLQAAAVVTWGDVALVGVLFVLARGKSPP